MKINKKKPVLVTGATGYVASWIVRKLLELGITVHAAVRNPQQKKKVAVLDELAKKYKGKIKYFKTDLLSPDSYTKAMGKCELVIHTASPFVMQVNNGQKDLVDPALKGTINVLQSVNKTSSVKRVVLTGSIYGIYGQNIDAKNILNHTLNESNWNTSTSVNNNPYAYSKMIAEKEAWKMVKDQSRWDLVVINPGLVVGPAINPFLNFESKRIIVQLVDGTFKSGVPKIKLGLVDVRDVAIAHLNAGFMEEVKGRYILVSDVKDFFEIASILNNSFKGYLFPKKYLPKFLVWLLAPMVGVTRKYISNNANYPLKFNNSKSINELGIKYIPVEKSLVEFLKQLQDEKEITPKFN